MTEFALILPLLVVLLFGIIQFGIIFNNYVTLTDAVRAGAREAAVSRQERQSLRGVCHSSVGCGRKPESSSTPADDHLCVFVGAGRRRNGFGLLSLQRQPPGMGCGERTAQLHHEGASRMRFARKREDGQAVVLMVLALAVLLGMCAMVLDVGSWYRTQRRLQGTADAAALAGAQQLPDTPSAAQTMALSYANQNGGNVLGADITVGTLYQANDIIDVTAKKTDSGFFSSVLGIVNADISATARARVGPPAQAQYVAPMVVYCDHPLIHNCNGGNVPTFGQPTHMDLDNMGAPGAFGMLDLSNSGGNMGSSTLGSWILNGYDQYLPLGQYDSDPGAKFSSQNVQRRPRRADRHRSAVPGLQDSRPPRLERGVRDHRLDRLPPQQLHGPRQQRHARRLLHRVHRPRNPRYRRQWRRALKFFRR